MAKELCDLFDVGVPDEDEGWVQFLKDIEEINRRFVELINEC